MTQHGLRSLASTLWFLCFSLSFSSLVDATCVAGNGFSPGGSLFLSYGAGVPANVRTAFETGKDNWNENACNEGGDDFPQFVDNQFSTSMVIHVEFVDGLSDFISPGQTACGLFEHGTRTITLYSKIKFPDQPNLEYPCHSTAEELAFLATHELGHPLGLANSPGGCNCRDYVMGGGAQFHNEFGDIVWSFPHQIHGDECDFVDEMHPMPNEDEEACPPEERNCEGQDAGTGSPILLDLDHNGYHLTGLDQPIWFDIDADGILEPMGWTSGDQMDGFLVLDRNGNGFVDDGSELFGDATILRDGSRARHGFQALAELDLVVLGGNGDGRIDARDEVFERLQIWVDRDHDGVSDAAELKTLAEHSLTRLELRPVENRARDRHGNQLRFRSRAWMLKDSPREIPVRAVDVFFILADQTP